MSAKNQIQLTKEQQKQVKQRMHKLKSRNTNNNSATQSMLPYTEIFKDGTCYLGGKIYSQTIEFFDTNYQLGSFDDKNSIFSSWCNLHNYFDDSIKFQFTYESQKVNKEDLVNDIAIPPQNDAHNDVRKEYSDMRCNQLVSGKNGETIKKYLTYSIEAKSLKQARTKLNSITEEVIKLFAEFRVKAEQLNGHKRLETIYHSLNPFSDEPFIFDWELKKRSGYSTKDFVAPMSMKFKKNEFELNEGYGSVTSINILAGELSDKFLTDYLDENLVAVNFHIKPFDQLKALKLVRGKLTDVERMKIDEQKKASMSGYDSDILPPSIQMYLEELRNMLEDLNSRNERLFMVTVTIRNYATSAKKNKLQLDKLKRITQKNNCKLFTLDYLQEQAFVSSLPLGYNAVPIERALPTSAVAVFVPFATKEIFQKGGTYYGLNAISKNMILGDRTKLKNPNGLIFGTPGSGKSFSVKREIIDVFLTTLNDIFITDPEGEYYPLVNYLGGQVVKIAMSSCQYINPMDISLTNIDDEDNPISTKSDFLISLCEIIIGGKYGLTSEERSIIDLCTRRIYNRFFQNNPCAENMPILADLLTELRKPDVEEVATRVANSLEMYVNGSQNLFNHRTNIDINNRLVCFDVKELGTQLKKVAMLIIQDQVWNRVSMNRDEEKRTRYYIDEFHLLLRDEQTAKYSVEIWKRFRKWGGIPTGITQNVKDILASPEIENILDNSDFIYMLNQASGDREILQEKLHISEAQIKYVTNSSQGKGLIFFGDTILPFEDEFPKDTIMYSLLTTNPDEKKLLEEKLNEATQSEE